MCIVRAILARDSFLFPGRLWICKGCGAHVSKKNSQTSHKGTRQWDVQLLLFFQMDWRLLWERCLSGSRCTGQFMWTTIKSTQKKRKKTKSILASSTTWWTEQSSVSAHRGSAPNIFTSRSKLPHLNLRCYCSGTSRHTKSKKLRQILTLLMSAGICSALRIEEKQLEPFRRRHRFYNC